MQGFSIGSGQGLVFSVRGQRFEDPEVADNLGCC